MASMVLAWPRTPLPVPPAGISFWASEFQSVLEEFALPVTEQSQLLPPGTGTVPTVALPRPVSVSPRSKQYSHFARAVALPSGV